MDFHEIQQHVKYVRHTNMLEMNLLHLGICHYLPKRGRGNKGEFGGGGGHRIHIPPDRGTVPHSLLLNLKRHYVRKAGGLRNHYVHFFKTCMVWDRWPTLQSCILNGELVDSTRATLHIWLKSHVPLVRCLLSFMLINTYIKLFLNRALPLLRGCLLWGWATVSCLKDILNFSKSICHTNVCHSCMKWCQKTWFQVNPAPGISENIQESVLHRDVMP